MDRPTDYFFGERYRGLGDIARLPAPLDTRIAQIIQDLRADGHGFGPRAEEFSQELLLNGDREVNDKFLIGDIKFPAYSEFHEDRLWRASRGQAPYIDRLVEQFPQLDAEMFERLWLERGRGMPRAFPAPGEQKAHWRSMDHAALGPVPRTVFERPFAAAIVTPRCGIGGSEKVMRELIASLRRSTGLPSLIVVADTMTPPEDLPAGAICLPNLSYLGEPFLRNPVAARVEALRDLLIESGVARVICINSFVGNALLMDGALQARGIKTASAIFCIALGAGGAIEGYVQIVDWLVDAGVALFTDNDEMARMIAARNFYDETVVLPIPETVKGGPPPKGPNVLWAGRIDAQKRPDLLLEIARRGPHIRYEVWGVPLLSDATLMEDLMRQPNIDFRGAFDGFAAIDTSTVGCLLYTTAYDGVPNLLLEAMGRGLPCVCTGVGGIPDLMADGRGWVLEPDAPAEAYIAALDRLRGDPLARQRMVRLSRLYISEARTTEIFDRSVAKLLAAL